MTSTHFMLKESIHVAFACGSWASKDVFIDCRQTHANVIEYQSEAFSTLGILQVFGDLGGPSHTASRLFETES